MWLTDFPFFLWQVATGQLPVVGNKARNGATRRSAIDRNVPNHGCEAAQQLIALKCTARWCSTAALGKMNLVECPQTTVLPRCKETAQHFGHSLAALEGMISACCRNARTGKVGARISTFPMTSVGSRTKKNSYLQCSLAGQQETVVLPSHSDRSNATVVERDSYR
jgi:hypothetical protein